MGTALSFDDQKKAQELLHSIHFFAAKGWCPATSTNHSFRLSQPDRFLISRSGVDKSLFQDSDFVVINNEGQLIDPGLMGAAQVIKPSAETELHTMLYARFPEVGSVLHTHSVLGTFLSRKFASEGHLRLEGWEILKGLQGNLTHDMVVDVPIVSNSQQMKDIIRDLEKHWTKAPHAFLISGHGLYTWGRTIAEAKRHVETLEFLFEVHQLGAK